MHLWVMMAITVVLATVESAVGSRVGVPELHLDVIPVIVAAWGSLRGFEEGMLLGAVAGIVLDVVSGAPFGLHTSVLVLLGAVTSTVDGPTVRANIGFIISMGVLVTVGYHVTLMLGMQASVGKHFRPSGFCESCSPPPPQTPCFSQLHLSLPSISTGSSRAGVRWRCSA